VIKVGLVKDSQTKWQAQGVVGI